MVIYSPQESVELFHLLFLDLLGRRIDKSCYALKGRCNLRFFMHGSRYSEDMDLDVAAVSVDKLQAAVHAVITGRALPDLLDLRGMRTDRWSAPEQTETTQRWEFALQTEGTAAPSPTKIEMSRRGMGTGVVFGPVDPVIIGGYGLGPLMVSHYGPTEACLQKVEALATRREPQARDVFDLHLLVATGTAPDRSDRRVVTLGRQAAANALAIGFDVFKAQVLSNLDPGTRGQYDSPEVWDDMVLSVVRALEAGAP